MAEQELREEMMSSEEEGMIGDDQDDQPPGTGPYATLHNDGPQDSAGASGHPDGCMPCTFYCFTRRGCNRGLDCRFCHLTHQSKLQQRREAWKKQQREKRKSIRGGGAGGGAGGAAGGGKVPVEPRPRSNSGSGGGGLGISDTSLGGNAGNATRKAVAAYGPPEGERRPTGGSNEGKAQPASLLSNSNGEGVGLAAAVFTYNPPKSVFTVGQEVEMLPQLVAVPVQFRLVTPLPQGLVLDQVSGVIRGAPATATPQSTAVIEANLLGGRTVRAAVDIEVVDFTRGGFVIGHMSEFEPGKFMLLLYVPDENGGNDEMMSGFPLEGANTNVKASANRGGLNTIRKSMLDAKPFFPGNGGGARLQQSSGGGAVKDQQAKSNQQQSAQQSEEWW